MSSTVFKLARDATEAITADGVELAASAKGLADASLEALATIVIHREIVRQANPERGIALASAICRSEIYRGGKIVDDLLSALNASTAKDGRTFVELDGAIGYLGDLGRTDGLGHAYAAVEAARTYPGQAIAIGRKIGDRDLDLVLRDAVVEVKHGENINDGTVLGQLQALSKLLDESELSGKQRILLVRPGVDVSSVSMELVNGKRVIKGTLYELATGSVWPNK